VGLFAWRGCRSGSFHQQQNPPLPLGLLLPSHSWPTHPVLLSFPTRSSISSPLIKPLTVFLHFLSLSHIPATKTITKTKASASVCSRLKTLTCHQLRVYVTGQSLRRTRAVRLHVPLADNGETKSRHDFPYFAKYDYFESSP
jgi:hypothetical protein